MTKPSLNRVSVEQWNVKALPTQTKTFPSGRKVVVKVAVRNTKGQFHGATNFKGSFL